MARLQPVYASFLPRGAGGAALDDSWAGCQARVTRVAGAVYKKMPAAEAGAWLRARR